MIKSSDSVNILFKVLKCSKNDIAKIIKYFLITMGARIYIVVRSGLFPLIYYLQ